MHLSSEKNISDGKLPEILASSRVFLLLPRRNKVLFVSSKPFTLCAGMAGPSSLLHRHKLTELLHFSLPTLTYLYIVLLIFQVHCLEQLKSPLVPEG